MTLEDSALRAGRDLVRASVRSVDTEGRLHELPELRRRRAQGRVALTIACLAVIVVTSLGLGVRATPGPPLDDPRIGLGPALPPPTSAPLMPAPADRELAPQAAGALQRDLDAWVAGDNGVGVTAAVVSAAGSWRGAAGRDGAGDELVPESAMAIGATTANFVAAEVMGLVARGVVDLDAPISDYVDLPFDTRGATVRQVLGMRSGFPLDPTREILASAAQDLGRSWTDADALALVDGDGTRQGPMGYLVYNNLNSIALGMLVEQATGTTLADSLRRDLLGPAGLRRVWVQDAERPEPPVAVGVVEPDSPAIDADGPWLPSRSAATALRGAGSMAADAPSLARWGYLLYGGHVLDSTHIAEMTSGGPDDWYGLGTVRLLGASIRPDGGQVVGYDSGTTSYTSILAVWPHRQLAIVVMTPERADPLSSVTIDGLLEQLRATARAGGGASN